MAKKYLSVCDNCGSELVDRSGATVRVSFNDDRRYTVQADYCDSCAGSIAGEQVARRGRPRSKKKEAEPVAA